MSAPQKLEWLKSAGGMMGPNVGLKLGGKWVGIFYVDANESIDADQVLADIVTRYNAHNQMLAALKALDDWWAADFPGGPDGDRSWAGGIGSLSDDTIEIWRAIRAAIATACEATQ